MFSALGDRTRFELVLALAKGEKCACELPAIVGRAQPTVSLQLKRLVEAGVLSSRKDGRKVLYRLSSVRVRAVLKAAGAIS